MTHISDNGTLCRFASISNRILLLLFYFLLLSINVYGQGVENSIQTFFYATAFAGLFLILVLRKLIVQNSLLKIVSIILAILILVLIAPSLADKESLTTRIYLLWPISIFYLQLQQVAITAKSRLALLFLKTFLLVGVIQYIFGIEAGYENVSILLIVPAFIYSINKHNKLVLKSEKGGSSHTLVQESIMMTVFLVLAIRLCSFVLEGNMQIGYKDFMSVVLAIIILSIISTVTTIVGIKTTADRGEVQ